MKKTAVLMIMLLIVTGCATSDSHAKRRGGVGAGIGAAGGALLGQLIGGNTQATLLGAGIGAVVGGIYGYETGRRMDEQEAEMRRQMAAVEAARVERHADILAVTMGSDVLFDVGSSSIKPGAEAQIQKVGQVLKKYPETEIMIAGHTDSTGSAKFNQQLSEHRANNVKLVLVRAGVAPSRIETIGFGQTAPVADNSTQDGRQQNRRVVITITPLETAA